MGTQESDGDLIWPIFRCGPSTYSSLFLVLVLVLVFDLVLDMLNPKIFSQSDGSLSSSSETLLRVVEEGSKVGEFKLIRILMLWRKKNFHIFSS